MRPSVGVGSCVDHLVRFERLRPQAQEMADGVNQIRPVEGIEVELPDALIDKVHDLLGGYGGGDQMRGLRIVLKAGKAAREPGRHGGAAAGGGAGDPPGNVDLQGAGNRRTPNAAGAGALPETPTVRG